jgi:phosphoribosylformylglycinamidine synthase
MPAFRVAIRIQLRQQILDVQGKTVENALHALHFTSVSDVHIGKYVELTLQAAHRAEAIAQAEDACRKLIANPVMEDFVIDVEEIPSAIK